MGGYIDSFQPKPPNHQITLRWQEYMKKGNHKNFFEHYVGDHLSTAINIIETYQ